MDRLGRVIAWRSRVRPASVRPIESEIGEVDLDPLPARELLLLAQEALHNALRHAGAGSVRVALRPPPRERGIPQRRARGFTPVLAARLVAAGVDLAPVLLHTGVSSQEAGEPPQPEWHHVPAATGARVNAASRLVAVGTTAVRALETAVDPCRDAAPLARLDRRRRHVRARGARRRRTVTGWHEPEASHLALLEAVAGAEVVAASYAAAAEAGYRWRELGDAHLVLP